MRCASVRLRNATRPFGTKKHGDRVENGAGGEDVGGEGEDAGGRS